MIFPILTSRLPVSAPQWTPAALPSLALWLTAGPTWCFSDAGGTVPCVDTDPVQVWKDRSGNAYNLLQATSGNRPTLRLVSGAWVVRYDGVDDRMSVSTAGAQPTGKNIAVMWHGRINNGIVLPFSRVGGSSPQWIIRQQNNQIHFNAYLGTGFGDIVVASANHTLGTTGCYIGQYDGSAVTISIDRAAPVSTPTTLNWWFNPSSEPIEMSGNNGGFNRLDGDVKSALIVSGVVSDTDKVKLLDYLGVP